MAFLLRFLHRCSSLRVLLAAINHKNVSHDTYVFQISRCQVIFLFGNNKSYYAVFFGTFFVLSIPLIEKNCWLRSKYHRRRRWPWAAKVRLTKLGKRRPREPNTPLKRKLERVVSQVSWSCLNHLCLQFLDESRYFGTRKWKVMCDSSFGIRGARWLCTVVLWRVEIVILMMRVWHDSG